MADFLKNIWSALGDREFYLRDFRNAYHYKPSQDPPRQQFGGYVSFVPDRDLYSELFQSAGEDELRIRMGSLVRSADMPQIEFKTQTMNEYNKKKIVNTGVEYQPVTIRVADTVSNAWLQIIMKYFAYHYMNPRNKGYQNDRDINSQTINRGGADFVGSQYGAGGPFDSNRYGYNVNENPNFFERIDYVLYHGGKGVQYSLLNPIMTGFTHTPIDYASNELMEFTMTFQYEGFTTYDQVNFDLSNFDLSRFEDVQRLTNSVSNQNFRDDGTKSLLGNTTRDYDFLGNKGRERNRTAQPQVSIPVDSPMMAGPGFTKASGLSTYDYVREPNTYFTKNLFGEFLGDVADRALSAAVNGADVKDAVIGGVLTNIADGIQDGSLLEFIRPDKPNPPAENENNEQENENTTPGG